MTADGPSSLLSLPGVLYVIIGPICAIFLAPAVGGLRRLRNLKTQIGGSELLAILDSNQTAPHRVQHKRRLTLGWHIKLAPIPVLIFAAVTTMTVLYGYLVWLGYNQVAIEAFEREAIVPSKDVVRFLLWAINTGLAWVFNPLTWLLFAPLFLFWRRLRRVTSVKATKLMADSDLPPQTALVLRSFVDDKVTVTPNSRTMRFQLRELRLEEVLVKSLGASMPCVALGSPNENLPELGAYRTYLGDEDWQPALRRWLEQSVLVLLISGTTDWVRWELRTIRELGITKKVIIVVPPGQDHRNERIKAIEDNLIGSDSSLFGFHPETLLVISFGSDNVIRGIHGGTAESIDYELAVLLARALADFDKSVGG